MIVAAHVVKCLALQRQRKPHIYYMNGRWHCRARTSMDGRAVSAAFAWVRKLNGWQS